MFNWHHGVEAAREAGVEVHVKPVSAGLRIHLVPAQGDSTAATVLDAAEWTPEGFGKLARSAFDCPESALVDFGAALEAVSSSSAEAQEAALEVSLGDWLRENVANPAVHTPFLNMVKSMFCQFPERASAGRLMKLMDLQVESAEQELQFTVAGPASSIGSGPPSQSWSDQSMPTG